MKIILLICIFPLWTWSSDSKELIKETYQGIALNSNDSPAYKEIHNAYFDKDRNIVKAKTEYIGPNGKVIGELESNFEKLLTAPEYSYKDLRNGSQHGIRITEDKYILYAQDKGKKEETKAYDKKSFGSDQLIVGCQGLHYYLINHLDEIKQKKKIPLKYLIPGKLDYYSFTLYYDKEDEDYVYLNIKINSLILRMFTSNLDLKYRKKDRRLVSYSGLSNITDDIGNLRNVKITYRY